MQTSSFIENYYWFFYNLNERRKIELINWLSSSMLENKEDSDDFFECFGAYISDISVEIQVEELRNARYFKDKNIEL